jgi:hypothetical protein
VPLADEATEQHAEKSADDNGCNIDDCTESVHGGYPSFYKTDTAGCDVG